MTTELYRQPSRTSQDQQLAAPSISAAFPPGKFPFAQIMYLRDKRQFWMRVGGPVGGGAFTATPVWELIGGPGAALGWPKYVVNVAGQEPVTPYQSIQAAVNAAVADGHGFANPTQVLVFPGTYVEDVLAVVGIHIVGFEGCEPGDTLVQGQFAVDPAVAVVSGSLRIANFDIQRNAKPDAPSVFVTGVGVAAVMFSNCRITGNGAEAVFCDNSNAASELIVRESTLARTGAPLAGGTGLLRVTAAFVGACFLEESDVTVNTTTQKAVQSAAGAGTFITDCQIEGRILIENATSCIVQRGHLHAIEQAVIDLAGAGPGSDLELLQCTVDHTTVQVQGPTVGGVGTALYGNVTWLHESRTAATVVTTAVRQRGPVKKVVIAGDTVANEVVDVVVADTGIALITYTLPPLGTVFAGEMVRFAVRSGVGGLTIAPAAGDTLDAGGPVFGVAIPAGTYPAYIADPQAVPAPNWVRVA